MKASITIESVLSSRSAGKNGEWSIATCLVTADYQGQPYAEKVQILHKGELPVGRLNESVSVNIALRKGGGDYGPSLSIVLISRLKKKPAA